MNHHDTNLQGKRMEPVTEDEILIDAVCKRRPLWDRSIHVSQRTKFKIHALWSEVSNVIGGRKTPTETRKRWQYLRDCYVKARRKMRPYVSSGSSVETVDPPQSSFRYYQKMQFLQTAIDPQDAMNQLVGTVYVTKEEPTVDDDIFTTQLSEPQRSCSYVTTEQNCRSPSEASNSANVRIRTTSSSSSSSTLAKIKKRPADISKLELEFLRYFKETQSKRDIVDSFLEQLGEILRRLPYIQRRNFQLRILTQAIEEEDKMMESNNELFCNS